MGPSRAMPGGCLLALSIACSSPDASPGVPAEPGLAPPDEALDDSGAAAPPAPRRVLLVVADDLSAASTPMYQADYPDTALQTAPMPTVQALCDAGVRFRHAWSAPSCSPSRAMMLTGHFPARNGTSALLGDAEDGIDPDEPSLPRLLAQWSPQTATANVGKWNLGRTEELGGDLAPNTMGWQHYAGLLDAVPADYRAWERTEDGVTAPTTDYLTTRTVDDAIAWLDAVGPDQPWVLWLAFNAPHTPYHVPPTQLHGYGALPDDAASISADPRPYKEAMVEAMDTELGRLLAWLDAHGQGEVDVLFVGDNGDEELTRQDPVPLRRSKGTSYDGGIHVPLCVAGPSVAAPGRTVDDLVSLVDIPATVLDLAGVPAAEALGDGTSDSRSFAGVLGDPAAPEGRSWSFAESLDTPDGRGLSWAVRIGDHKLIRFFDEGHDELYRLDQDPWEQQDLLAGTGAPGQPAAHEALPPDDLAAARRLRALLRRLGAELGPAGE